MTPGERVQVMFEQYWSQAVEALRAQLEGSPTREEVERWLNEPAQGALNSGFATGANIGAIIQVLDEEHERRQAFEAGVLRRLAALESK